MGRALRIDHGLHTTDVLISKYFYSGIEWSISGKVTP